MAIYKQINFNYIKLRAAAAITSRINLIRHYNMLPYSIKCFFTRSQVLLSLTKKNLLLFEVYGLASVFSLLF